MTSLMRTVPHDMPPTWHAACLAYCAVRRTGAGDETAWVAARATVLQEFPTMSVRTAGEQASDAISHASIHHRTWLWHHLNGPKLNTQAYPTSATR